MKRQPLPARAHVAAASIGLTALCCLSSFAAETPRTVRVRATDLNGKQASVPLADRPSVLLFVRVGQEQSQDAVERVQAALKGLPDVQVLVVLSGADPSPEAKRQFAAKLPWPVVDDPDYTLVGQLAVRVWPTNIVVLPDGKELARLTGMPQSYARDLVAYLSFATGAIDRKTLDERLATASVVGDSNQQMASRHLRVAQRLMEKTLLDPAWQEVEKGLTLQPKDPDLLLAKARVLLLLGKPDEALDALKKLDAGSAKSSRAAVLRGGAMVALKKWDQAAPVLQDAIRLNPDPAEAYYYLGIAHQQKGQWAEAAKAFRSAFETTPLGRPISRSLLPPEALPATQPATPGPAKPAKP